MGKQKTKPPILLPRGYSLAVQRLGLRILTAKGPGLTPGRGTKIPQGSRRGQQNHISENEIKKPFSLTLGLGADEAGRGVVEGLEDPGDGQADVLVTGVQADGREAEVLKAGRLLRTHLDVGDLKREELVLPSCSPSPALSLQGPAPHPRLASHLLLSTDMAHGGGRRGAGGGSQDRHNPLGQDLTHCEGQEEIADSGACFLLFCSHPWGPFPGLGENPTLHIGLPDPPPCARHPEARSLTWPIAGEKNRGATRQRETRRHGDRGPGQSKRETKRGRGDTKDLLLAANPVSGFSAFGFLNLFNHTKPRVRGSPGDSVVKESTCNAGDTGATSVFHPRVGKIPWRRKW